MKPKEKKQTMKDTTLVDDGQRLRLSPSPAVDAAAGSEDPTTVVLPPSTCPQVSFREMQRLHAMRMELFGFGGWLTSALCYGTLTGHHPFPAVKGTLELDDVLLLLLLLLLLLQCCSWYGRTSLTRRWKPMGSPTSRPNIGR